MKDDRATEFRTTRRALDFAAAAAYLGRPFRTELHR